MNTTAPTTAPIFTFNTDAAHAHLRDWVLVWLCLLGLCACCGWSLVCSICCALHRAHSRRFYSPQARTPEDVPLVRRNHLR